MFIIKRPDNSGDLFEDTFFDTFDFVDQWSLNFFVSINDNFTEESYNRSFVHFANFVDTEKLDIETINEMTCCVAIRPLVLLPQTVMSIGEMFSVTLINLLLGLIGVEFDGLVYMVQLSEPLLPKRWHRLCLALGKSKELVVVFDGEKVVNVPSVLEPLNLNVANMSVQGLTLGFMDPDEYRYDVLRSNKFHGEIYGLYLWSKVLAFDIMVNITGKACQEVKDVGDKPDLFDWDKAVTNVTDTDMLYKVWGHTF